MTLQWLSQSGQLGQTVTLVQGRAYRWRSRWSLPCTAVTASALSAVRTGLQSAGFGPTAIKLTVDPNALGADWPEHRKDPPGGTAIQCTLYTQAVWPLPNKTVDLAALQVPGVVLVDIWDNQGNVLFGAADPKPPIPFPPGPTGPTPIPGPGPGPTTPGPPGPVVPGPDPVLPPGPAIPPPGPPPGPPPEEPPTEPPPTPKAPKKEGLSTGVKIGIGVAVAGLAFVLFTR